MQTEDSHSYIRTKAMNSGSNVKLDQISVGSLKGVSQDSETRTRQQRRDSRGIFDQAPSAKRYLSAQHYLVVRHEVSENDPTSSDADHVVQDEPFHEHNFSDGKNTVNIFTEVGESNATSEQATDATLGGCHAPNRPTTRRRHPQKLCLLPAPTRPHVSSGISFLR